MKITKAKLEELKACEDGVAYFEGEELEGKDLNEVVDHCLFTGDFDYANWLLTELMTVKQRRMYTVFAAEQVLDLFEKEFPNDNRPRKAIEAAKAVIKSETSENLRAALSAASALSAVYAARSAAYAAARAARSAAYAAGAAAYAAARAARSAAYAAGAAAAAGAAYVAADCHKTKERIAEYGIELVLQVK